MMPLSAWYIDKAGSSPITLRAAWLRLRSSAASWPLKRICSAESDASAVPMFSALTELSTSAADARPAW